MNEPTTRRAPPVLLGVLAFGLLIVTLVRGAVPLQGSPVFFPSPLPAIHIEAGTGFPTPGIYQFYDDTDWGGVMEMTLPSQAEMPPFAPSCPPDPTDGLTLHIAQSPDKSTQIQCDWISAGRRMALGVKLHPDRMSEQDWQALPGIGPALAHRIEMDRQVNGGFGRLEALRRVNGIGPKRIAAWRRFFL